MSNNHVAVWPKVKLVVNGKRKIIERGQSVPDGVSDADLANLVSFGAIAGVSVAATPAASDASDGKPTSVKDILKDVGDDKAKAQEYLDAENATEKPRTSLVEGLQAVLDAE